MSNYASVDLPTSQSVLSRIYSVSYRQQNYEHDYAKIMFRNWGLSPSQAKPGTPIAVTLRGKTMYGYIHDVKSVQDNNRNFTQVGFIGASYVMRQTSQKIYKNVSADQVVKEIAKKYGFAYRVVQHPRVVPQISQAGMTDWEFMVKLAKQSGYLLRAENTALYFQPILQDFGDKITEAEKFDKNDAGFKSLKPMYSFKPTVGETLSHFDTDKSAVSVAGINPETGEYFKYTKQRRSMTTRSISQPELFDRHATTVVVNNYDAAVSEAYSADTKSAFAYMAEAEVIGSVNLRPGLPVYLGNVGKEYSGYWTVLGVEHYIIEESLNQQRHTTRISVGSDSLGEVIIGNSVMKPSSQPIRNIIPNVRNTQEKPGTILYSPSLHLSPNMNSALVNRTNRPDLASKTLAKTVWKSTHGDLSIKKRPPSRPPLAWRKVVGNLARI